MWKKIRTSVKQLPIRWKMTVVVLVLFVSMAACILGVVTRYSTRHYTKLQQQYNEAVMQEVSVQLDTVCSNIDTLYRTFNSQRLFTSETQPQKNTGEPVWDAVKWLLEEDAGVCVLW